MILLADSGSTKTEWRLLSPNGSIAQAQTIGLNPYFSTETEIATALREQLLPQLQGTQQPQEVYFYGAGCSSPAMVSIVETAFKQVFTDAAITVEHDLLAAARALCGHEPGIACILGTGSNTCLYDGAEILENIPALGIWLGDEGSGGFMGKQLIQDFLNKEMPENLHQKFAAKYQLTKDDVLENVYRKPLPNRYLASFSKFLFDNRKDPYAHNLVTSAFQLFFKRTVCKYTGYETMPVHCTGSVGFFFADILRRVARDNNINLQRILQGPIAGLTLFHQQKAGYALAGADD